MEVLKIFNEENSTQEEIDNFVTRMAVRGIILDSDGKMALIHARKNSYYCLPGGGVEKGETMEEGFLREMKEETGCHVEIVKELGRTLEMRKRSQMVNDTTCFIAKVVGEKGDPQMTQAEIELEDMEVIWVSPEEGKSYIESSDTKKDLYHGYVARRDLTFLSR